MLRHRKIVLFVTVITVAGSLSATLGYAIRLRTPGYRAHLAARLTDTLGLRVAIGGVQPLSFKARLLEDVHVWLPRRDAEVFQCRQAVWHRLAEGDRAFGLELRSGWLLAGADAWGRADYSEMLRGGLGHDFAALGLRRIELSDFDVQWRLGEVVFAADGVSGEIIVGNDGVARAALTSNRINDVSVSSPIRIIAQFTPGERLRFHEVELKAPSAPLAALRLEPVLGEPVTRGTFAGSVRYDTTRNGQRVTVRGAVRGASLRELTAPLPGGPYNGYVDVVVDEAVFADRALQSLRFSGRLGELKPAEWAGLPQAQALGGELNLRVHQAVYESGKVSYVAAQGSATGVLLDALTAFVGEGRMTGTLDMTIDSLLIVDGRLAVADVTVNAVPPPDAPGVIDRRILKRLSERALGFDATALVPESIESIEYARLGARLGLSGSELRVRGTHGDDNRTILTIKLFNREFGVLKEPDEAYQVGDLLSRLRDQLSEYDQDDLRAWWLRAAGAAEGGD